MTSAPIKVAHITTIDLSLHWLLLNQLKAIRAAGYEVVGISSPGPHVKALDEAGLRHIPVPMTRAMTPHADLISLWKLYQVLRRERFTIIHTHTPKAGLVGQYAALLARVPVRLHTIHGLYVPLGATGWKRRFFLNLERITMAFSQLNLSQNPEDLPTVQQERLCAPDRIELLGNGIDLSMFDPGRITPEQRATIRAKLGFSAEQTVIGIVGRLVAEKGFVEMLQAAHYLSQRFPQARFLFVGPLEPEKQDRFGPELAHEMGLDAVVHFAGSREREEMPLMYASMDIFTLPSYREGFPRSSMEAAAMGLPVVTTDVRGCRQTVTDGVTGYLVPVKDSQRLAEALAHLLENADKRQAFGAAGRQKALTEFDEQVVFARVLNAYERLLKRGPINRQPDRQR